MSYWNNDNVSSTNSSNSNNVSIYGKTKLSGKSSGTDEFYEIEPAVVLDIILDSNHSFFKQKKPKLNPDQWPPDINGNPASVNDLDFTWIGRVLIRLLYNQKNVRKEDLIWAKPLESNISEYPILNEIVGVVYYLGEYFYTKKINKFNTPNANADFNTELSFGGFRNAPNAIVQGNSELNYSSNITQNQPYSGSLSKLNTKGSIGYSGALGRYFVYNNRVRSLQRYEGDMVLESRFGQSVRFGAYDDNRNNDSGHNQFFGGYGDYKGNGIINKFSNLEQGGGNPMILIRNRQRPLDPLDPDEKNVGGYMSEDINNDGTSIHLTSGITLSLFKTTCFKKMWGNGSEEQSGFNGQTSFVFPKLMGDQLIINSDRVIISSKKNEMFHYSKKRMSFVTDNELTFDAQNQIVINTNTKMVINSPAIYLGQYDETGEPALLGQTTVNWLYNLCNLLIEHTHWYKHTHSNIGEPDPIQTQMMVQVSSLIVMREQLNTLMSRRVFLTGGGFSPGENGVSIVNGSQPVSIDTISGTGVPGEFNGQNFRTQ